MKLTEIKKILEEESLNWPWIFLWRYLNPTPPGCRYHNGLDWFDYLMATDEQLFYCKLIVGMYAKNTI